MVLKDDLPLKWSPVTRWPFKVNKTINFKGHKKMKKLLIGMTMALTMNAVNAAYVENTYSQINNNPSALNCDYYLNNYNVIDDRINGDDLIITFDNDLQITCAQDDFDLKQITMPKDVAADVGIDTNDFAKRKFLLVRNYGQATNTIYPQYGKFIMIYETSNMDIKFNLESDIVKTVTLKMFKENQFSYLKSRARGLFEAWREGGKWKDGHQDFSYQINANTCVLELQNRYAESEFSFGIRTTIKIDFRKLRFSSTGSDYLYIDGVDAVQESSSGSPTVTSNSKIIYFDDDIEKSYSLKMVKALIESCNKN